MSNDPRTIRAALAHARQALSALSESAGLDAQVLLAHITGQGRTWLLAHPEAALSQEQSQAFELALARLEDGEPLPYELGEWEFYGLPFTLTPDVLIPRPETELLVETALIWLEQQPGGCKAADIATGSGCIAIALATHRDDLTVTASDISHQALKVARANAARHAVSERVILRQADLLDGLEGPFNLICANLPYIPSKPLPGLAVFGREPTLALDGGPQGLDLIARLLAEAPPALAPRGLLLLEIDSSQGDSAPALARQHFPSAQIEIKPDLAGHPRLMVISV